MDESLVKNIVESLMSNNVNQEYLGKYLNDLELKKQCDEMISEYIKSGIKKRYDFNLECINYLNNVIKPQLNKKPYLLNINIIKNTLEDYLIELDADFNKADEDNLKDKTNLNKIIYEIKCDRVIDIINMIDTEFVFKNSNILDAEERIANIYINRMKNNNNLSKEQVEELLAFAISGGFILKHEEYTDKAFDYALKMVLNNDYKINKYLYKRLFLNSCLNILDEKGIRDIKFEFVDSNDEMSFSPSKKTIYINEEELNKRTTIQNFMSFFHEFRHYEQHNRMASNSLKRFLFEKEIFLFEELAEDKYYKKNYRNHFTEKDAYYMSYEYLYDFINEKAPSKILEAKKEIYRDLMICMLLENKYITERKRGNDTKDINVLFEESVRNKKKKDRFFFDKYISSPLFIEYDIFGNKRSIFELLESKEYNEKNDVRSEIINYLLYEESVSIDYIIKNIKMFDNKKNKDKYGKYYKEARKVIKHKVIRYASDTLTDKRNKLNENSSITLETFYDIVIDKLRKKNIKGLNKDKNIELYREREEELRIAYKWLYTFSKEIEKERSQETLEEFQHKSK